MDGRGRLGAVVILAAVAAACAPSAAARQDAGGDRPYWRTNLFKRVATDQKFLVTRWWPAELKGNPAFGSVLAAGLVVAAQSGTNEGGGEDLEWETGIAGSASPQVQAASHVFTKLGNGAPIAAVLGITYLAARRAHADHLAETSSLAAESLLDAGIWIEVLKLATARMRPGEPDAGSFFHYERRANGSFPSGHAMGAFAVAAAVAGSYDDKRWVSWMAYGTATLIAGSRLALGRHFPADVLVGSVLGASIGRGVVARSRDESPRSHGAIAPVVGPGSEVGVGWSYTWR